ncbi:unnamed protein product [Closterium sp. NIES-64]|nr:unnamed protein product [Closterium sp. NIES-64]
MSPSPSFAPSLFRAACDAPRRSSHAAAPAGAPASLIRLTVVAAALLLLQFTAAEAQPTPGQQPSPIRPPLSSSPPFSSSPSSSPPSPSTFSPFQPLLLGGLQANLTPILLPASTSPTPTTPTSTALNPTTTTLTPGSIAAGATPGSLSGASTLPSGGASVVTLLVNAANATLAFALPWAQGAGENVQAGIYTVGDMLNASSPRLVLPLMGITANSTPPAAASATRATSASSSSSPLDPLTAAAAGVAGVLGGLGTSAAGVMAGLGVTTEPGVTSGATAGPQVTAGATGAARATGTGEGLGATAASTAPGTQAPRRGLSGSVSNPVAAAAGAAQGAVGGAVGAVQGVVRRGSGWLWGAVPVPGAALVNILRDPGQYQLRLSVGTGADVASFAGRLVSVPIDLARSIPFLGSLIPKPPRFPSQPSLGIPNPQSFFSGIPDPQSLISLATAIRESIASLPQAALGSLNLKAPDAASEFSRLAAEADKCAANSAANPAPDHVVVTLDEENACLRECAVCLGDYDEGERIKLLPPCGHRFHADCIDLWLSSKSTCPICRKDLRPAAVTAGETCEKGSRTPRRVSESAESGERIVTIVVREESGVVPDGDNDRSPAQLEAVILRRDGDIGVEVTAVVAAVA